MYNHSPHYAIRFKKYKYESKQESKRDVDSGTHPKLSGKCACSSSS